MLKKNHFIIQDIHFGHYICWMNDITLLKCVSFAFLHHCGSSEVLNEFNFEVEPNMH